MKPESYYTLTGEGVDEIIIEKSRFIAYATHATSDAEATEWLAGIRSMHREATHCCSAWMAGWLNVVESQRADDDGEPSGTAGKPILEVIKKNDLHDTAIAVVRYFGGIKLGAGGLIRAYGKSAGLGVQAAGILRMTLQQRFAVSCSYELSSKLDRALRNGSYFLEKAEYDEKVTFYAHAAASMTEYFQKDITEWSYGQAEIRILDMLYLPAE